MADAPCACRDYCGDVPEDQDRPDTVCKLRPGRSGGAVVDRGPCGRLLVGQGGDTYDPTCVLPASHGGRCKPSTGED